LILHIVDSLLIRPALDRFGRPIPEFNWHRWENHDSTLIGLALLTLLYLYALGPYRARARVTERVSGWRVASFFCALVVMFFALNGPIHDLSDYYLFSIHMVQHLMLTQIVAPLLLLGLMPYMARALLRPAWVRATARVLSRPAVAFLLYTVSFTAWHLQPAYDLMMRNHNVHIVTHLQFMVTAVILWWPVVGPLEEYRLSHAGQMLYLFLIGIPMMCVAALITLADVLLYPWYAPSPRVWGLSPLDDQKVGGLIMWVPGGLFYWIAMSFVFFAWVKREREEDAAEAEARGSA
jgi:putative membrane protein